jgi:hypothetical protein
MGKRREKRAGQGLGFQKNTHTHTHPTKWAFQFSETITPKTVEEKIHWVTCPPITLIDRSKVLTLNLFCNWDQWFFLLMKFHHFATYSKGLPQPLLKPPPPRGINFAKILGLWIRVSWSQDVTMELLTSESSSALLVNVIILLISQYFSHIFPSPKISHHHCMLLPLL